jgi:chlorobactene glucosyltransferase
MGYALAAIGPWLLLALYMGLRVREPRALPPPDALRSPRKAADLPLVSIIVPARNEALAIERCLESLAAQRYPAFEILVVDDRSEDDTAERALRVGRGNAREIRVIEGRPLPEGWFGKPWACLQGARESEGALLLFTDADTWHGPDLLARCVAGLGADEAQALSPVGRQEMRSFGERLVQPQMFALLGLRYPMIRSPIEPPRWPHAILSGQYLLVTREAYEGIGGHEAVKGEVVEDLRLAQELVRAGNRITLRGAGDDLSTRMYRSLAEAVNGWTKNVAIGARQAGGWLGPLAIPGMAAFLLGVWIVPPLVLVAALVSVTEPTAALPGVPGAARPLLVWAGGATGISLLLWAGAYRRLRAPIRYAPLYPLGATVAIWIGLRSWLRGSRKIVWKGRTYSGGKAESAS